MLSTPSRIVWIDRLRGTAVLGMLIFHVMFDLQFLNLLNVDVFRGPWMALARAIQFTFLTLVGVSLFVSSRKSESRRELYRAFFCRHLRRAAMLMGFALMITVITYRFIPDQYIRFGILHLISVSIVLALFFVRRPLLALVLAPGVMLLGPWWVTLFSFSTILTLPIGITRPDFVSLDYFPLIPWFGLVLFGIGIGPLLEHRGLFRDSPAGRRDFLSVLGQKALAVYLIHQPVLLATLYAFNRLFLAQ